MKNSVCLLLLLSLLSCSEVVKKVETQQAIVPDTSAIPNDEFGELVKYGRELLLNTAYYIGPQGVNGQFTGNKMNCTNCHQDAGTKPFSFNLMRAHERYPQYRSRENKVLTIADRINNCVMRPHNGIPLPYDSKEMIAIQSYLKWINTYVAKTDTFFGEKNFTITFPDRAADPIKGGNLYVQHCQRCHGADGEGIFQPDSNSYLYPPLWGYKSYQPGSSMHRVIMQARWIKANMPHDIATWDKPLLTDEEALDIAAFVNNDSIHVRNVPVTFDYPNPNTKPIDYGVGPFADTFSANQHKFGPYKPIIEFWKANGLKPNY